MLRLLTLICLLPCLATPAFARTVDDDVDQPLVVRLVINGSVGEEPAPVQPIGPQRRNFRAKLERIRELAGDPAVDALELRIKGSPDHARTLDLLDELRAFKASGKKLVCYTEMLTRSDLVFASLADVLAVPPTGMIMLEGYSAELLYMRDMLAKIDARAEVMHIGEFKTAYENLSREGMSDGQRAVLGELLGEFYSQTLDVIATNRGMQVEQVDDLFAQLMIDPTHAAEIGLIDGALYEDEYTDRVTELLGSEFELDTSYGEQSLEELEAMMENPFAAMGMLSQMLNPPKQEAPDEPYVAVVYASGQIMSGKSTADFSGNVSTMGSDTIVAALRKVEKDELCKAVVLRVNSPGGSALASDMIWRAVEKVQEHKPVISSMGSVAASGGYWISMGCDVIVAQPSTITGSIGVVSMVPDISQTLKNVGIKVETVSRGPQGDALSLMAHGVSPLLRETLTRSMQDTYERFLAQVAEGRELPVERVRELAAGRVWTGRQAEANGLVDSLGGLQEAIELAAVLAQLDPDEAPLVEYPEPPNFFDQLEDSLEDLVVVRSPVEELLDQLGFGADFAALRELLSDPRALHADRVQALMPFSFVVR